MIPHRSRKTGRARPQTITCIDSSNPDMGLLTFDIRDALRSFRRDRTYAIVAIATLALTIGATTAVFSIVNSVLLRPLAYPASDRLVALRETWQQFSARFPTLEVNERHFDYWREHARSFESMAQFQFVPANLTGSGDAAQISIVRCSGTLFDVLQVQAAMGRTLTARDESEDAANVAVITDALWRQRFDGDPRMVGNAIVLDGKPYTVVGILPPEVRLSRGQQTTGAIDAFIPLRVNVGWVGDHNNEAIGRLGDQVTVEQARAELDVLQAQISEIATKEAHEPVTLSSAVIPLVEHVVGASRPGLMLLLGAIGAVLLIACSNLANLSLTRTLGRVRDAAIRSALGASRRRLLGRAVLEQLLLSIAGGALGLWVAWMGLALFVRTAPVDLPRANEVQLDARALAFAAVVSILAGIFTAVIPAWRLAGRDQQAALRASAASVATDRGGLRAHATLVALQVALSVTLLVAAALFGASLMRVLNVDRGFAPERVLVVDVALPTVRYGDERVRQATYDRVLAAIHRLPGVVRATTVSSLPLRGQTQVNFIAREGSRVLASELPTANFRFVAPEFFGTLGMAIQQGRSFTDAERDPNRPAPALVSQATARRLWPNEDPLGKRFSRAIENEQGFEVVGVAADARLTSLDREQPLMVYVPYWWRSRPALALLIKTADDRLSIMPDVRRAIGEIDPDIAIGQARPLQQLVDAAMAGRRYQTELFVAFGLVALFIATVGVYGATAYGVSRRRREMNLRVALGARTAQVIGLILRQGTAPVLAGVLLGAGGALAIGGLLSSLLFEVRPRDPMIIGLVIVLVGGVSLATAGLVARRGLSIDPSAALRDE